MERLRRAMAALGMVVVVTGLAASSAVGFTGSAGSAPRSLPRRVEPVGMAGKELMRAVQAIAPDTSVGVEVYDRDSGRTVLDSSADQQFPSASVVKLLIALDALARPGSPDVPGQVHQMLANSDDTIASALWGADGGPDIVTRTAARLRLSNTQPPADPGQWGNTLTTPSDVVATYRYITSALPAPERSVIIDALASAPQQAADGWDQYFGIPDGLPGLPRAIKQGWMTGDPTVLHTTGLVGEHDRYVVALMTSTPSEDTLPDQTKAITAAAAALAPLVKHH